MADQVSAGLGLFVLSTREKEAGLEGDSSAPQGACLRSATCSSLSAGFFFYAFHNPPQEVMEVALRNSAERESHTLKDSHVSSIYKD